MTASEESENREQETGDAPMSLGDHFAELRSRLGKSVLALIVCAGVCLFFQDQLMEIVNRPRVEAMNKIAAERAEARRLKRLEELKKSDPFKKLNREIETRRTQRKEADKLLASTASLAGGENSAAYHALDSFVKAENELDNALSVEGLVKLHESRRDLEIALLSVENAKNQAALGEHRARLMAWTDLENNVAGFLKDYLVILQEEFDTSRELKNIPKLQALKPQETFLTYLKLAIICGIFFASPFIFYQLWQFIAVGLYKNERKFVRIFAPGSLVLFIIGASFGYYMLMPLGLQFLASYGDPELVENSFTMSFYLSFFMLLTILVGVVFQLPLVMYGLARVGLVEPRTFSKYRRYFLVAAFVLAAIFTPPDVVTQILLGIPMLFLYEFGIILAKLAYRARKQNDPYADVDAKREAGEGSK